MRPLLKQLTVICSAALLLACADAVQRGVEAPAPAFASADDAYAVGRSEHMAMRFDVAGAAYEAALRVQPGHVNARNGLAALHAERGDLPRAIALWQELTAAPGEQAGGSSGYLWNNLGYAHFLKGDYAAARTALEKACTLDPLNHRAWEHLGQTLDKLGQPARAKKMLRQARTLRSHDLKADYAATVQGKAGALDFAVRSSGPAEPQWDRTEVRETGNGMFLLRRVRASGDGLAAASAPERGFEVPVRGPSALLEIRNGNGVNGMARELAARVGDDELEVVRLTNHKGYGVARTRIEHGPSHRAAAERLAERVGSARVVEVGKVGRVDLRLVLGRDLTGARVAAIPVAPPALAAR